MVHVAVSHFVHVWWFN